MSLRARIALSAALAAAVILVIAGILIVRLTEHDERSTLNTSLKQQATVLSGPLTRLVGSPLSRLLDRAGAEAIDGDRTIRVLTASGETRLSVGPALPAALGRTSAGESTVTLAGHRYRVYAVAGGVNHPLLAQRSGAAAQQVQVIAPLAPLDGQVQRDRHRIFLVGAGAALLIAIMAWLLTGASLRSLRRLQAAAEEIATTGDLTTRLEPAQPAEVATVIRAFNAMLTRLHVSAQERGQALDTARSFAADAMHELRTPLTSMGANLEALHAGSGDGRAQLVDDLVADHSRVVATLEALNALTVAEVAAPPVDPLDLADLIEVAAGEAPRRHPGLEVSVDVPQDAVQIAGSREAMRMVIDNLLANAQRHAREPGDERPVQVRLTVHRDGDDWVLTVDDDGPGFPAERDRLLGRFERGETSVPGSGLGLAIVAQQVRRHGGTVTLGDSPHGGAQVAVRLPAY